MHLFPCRETGSRGRIVAAIPALIATLAFLLVMSAGMALAHATLIGSEPADNAVLDTAPAEFSLRFNEPVSPIVLSLIGSDSTRDLMDGFSADGSSLVIAAPEGLEDGSYGLSWRVVSEDGHPVGGTVLFSIGAPGGALAVAGGAVDRVLAGTIWAARVLVYIGLFIGVGGVFFTRWIGGRTRQGDRVMGASIIAGLVAAPLSWGLQGLDMLGQPLGNLAAGAPWATALASSYAKTVMLAVIALFCGLIALRGIVGKALSVTGFVLIGLALMASGHVSSADPHWLTRPAIFVHAVMIAFWIGALVPLIAAFTARTPDAQPMLARFSRLIPWSLLLLIGAGIAMARVQVGAPQALTDTAYGRVFLVKLALLVALFSVAAINRFRLTAPVARGEARAITRFRRAVMVELVLVLAIFATVALWRFTPPPRALAMAEAIPADTGPAMVHIEAGGNMVMVHVEPDRAGPVAVEIYVYDMEADAIPAQEVTLIMANPAAGIEPIRRRIAAPDEYDAWHVDDLTLPVPGDWSVRVEALISDFDLLKAEGIITIAR